MAWYYEVRGPMDNVLFFGGGHPTRADAEKAAQTVMQTWPSRNLEKLQVRIGVTNRVYFAGMQ